MKTTKKIFLTTFAILSLFLLTHKAYAISVNVVATPSFVPYNGSSTISWTSNGAYSCTSSWGQSIGTSGSYNTGALEHKMVYSVSCINEQYPCESEFPPDFVTACHNRHNETSCMSLINHNINPPEPACSWSGSSSSDTATVSVAPPVFGVNVTATPSSVLQGNSSNITWTSVLANSCSSSTGQGGTGTSGNFSVAPGTTTSYGVTCTRNITPEACVSSWGSAIDCYSSNVPPATNYGTCDQYCGTSQHNTQSTCNNAQASPGGQNPLQNVCVWMPGNSQIQNTSDTATVTVTYPPVTCSSHATPSSIISGQSSIISWISDLANGCNTGGHGTGVSGSFNVSPTTTTNYPITCTRNAQTIPGPCLGTYTISTSHCVGTVTGSICSGGGQLYEGQSCDIFEQSACPGNVDPWCQHGCHWRTSGSTGNCSDFTTSSQCSAHPTCVWGSGYTVPSSTASCGTSVTVSGTNGVCAAAHYNCAIGTSTNHNETSTSWTWNCNGTNGGNNASCSEQKNVTTTGTISATNCTVASGSSTCNTTLVWNTVNPITTSAVTTPVNITVANANSSSGTLYPISVGSRTFYLYNNGVLLAQATATATTSNGSTSEDCSERKLPDLTAGPITPTTATVNLPVNFQATITNIGGVPTGAGFWNFMQLTSNNPNGNGNSTSMRIIPIVHAAGGGGGNGNNNNGIIDLGSTYMPALPAYGSDLTNKSYTFSASGTYYMRACADKKNSANKGVIAESNENNNCGAWTTIVVNPSNSNLPDLTAGTITPTSGIVNTPIALSAMITNIGASSTGGPFNNFMRIAPLAGGNGSWTDLPSSQMSTLGVNASGTLTTSYTFPSTGTYSAQACADAAYTGDPGTKNELSETNNCGPWTNIIITTNMVNGVCRSDHYNCSAGITANASAVPPNWTWDCVGLSGGTTAHCSQAMPPNAAGVCGTTHFNCIIGTSTENTGDQTSGYKWKCVGLGGTALCTELPVLVSCNNNGIKDNGETGIDCGGPICPACEIIPKYKER